MMPWGKNHSWHLWRFRWLEPLAGGPHGPLGLSLLPLLPDVTLGAGYSLGNSVSQSWLPTHLPLQPWAEGLTAARMDPSSRSGKSQHETLSFARFILLKYMGAENRNHPYRLCPREMLLPCRHAASLRPPSGLRGWGRASPVAWAPQKHSNTRWEGQANDRVGVESEGGGWDSRCLPVPFILGSAHLPKSARNHKASAIPPFSQGPTHPGTRPEQRPSSHRWNVHVGISPSPLLPGAGASPQLSPGFSWLATQPWAL